ncbi:hypothetical protein MTO96_024829 [Rhipicephalus appendiculatus]
MAQKGGWQRVVWCGAPMLYQRMVASAAVPTSKKPPKAGMVYKSERGTRRCSGCSFLKDGTQQARAWRFYEEPAASFQRQQNGCTKSQGKQLYEKRRVAFRHARCSPATKDTVALCKETRRSP